MSVNIRKSVARWRLDDMSIVQAAGRPIDSDYVFVLLIKAQQLREMKAFEEAMDLLVGTFDIEFISSIYPLESWISISGSHSDFIFIFSCRKSLQ